MARTIQEIVEGIKVDFVRNETLRNAYSLTGYNADADAAELVTYYNNNFGNVSVETCLIYVFATCAVVLEKMMDWFTEDVTQMISEERYGHTGWYEKKALQFRYGADINTNYLPDPENAVDGDFAENDVYPELSDTSELEELQVVKYAYCEDNGNRGILLKIAGISNDILAPLDEIQLEAFTQYMNRIKPAGIPISVINSDSDRLTLNIQIYYNPLVLNGNGELIVDTAVKPVENAIRNYLNSIEFNGEFISMKLIDAIQAVDGVDIAELVEATQQHANYAPETINTRYAPYSGYFIINIDEDCQIDYIPNN
ncbi:MAG: hypothetical protein PHQ33_07390 [Bacteroidales bacterium]|nr:hypothetical protein [Bacteroidales bacterium]